MMKRRISKMKRRMTSTPHEPASMAPMRVVTKAPPGPAMYMTEIGGCLSHELGGTGQSMDALDGPPPSPPRKSPPPGEDAVDDVGFVSAPHHEMGGTGASMDALDMPPPSPEPEEEEDVGGAHHEMGGTGASMDALDGPPPSPPRAVVKAPARPLTYDELKPRAAPSALVADSSVSSNPPPNSFSLRCYRLSLENLSFDIHANGPLLEYGDYMTPWLKEDLPKCAGPLEYVPPPHLGKSDTTTFISSANLRGMTTPAKAELSPEEDDEDEGNYFPDCDDGSKGIFRREAKYAGTGFFSFPDQLEPVDKPVPAAVSGRRNTTGGIQKKSSVSSLFSIFGPSKAKRERRAAVKAKKSGKRPPRVECKIVPRLCHAEMIANAVLLVDAYTEKFEEGDEEPTDKIETNEKGDPNNVSIYAIGNYEILDDLCRDGSQRLTEGKDLSDIVLMSRNRPHCSRGSSVPAVVRPAVTKGGCRSFEWAVSPAVPSISRARSVSQVDDQQVEPLFERAGLTEAADLMQTESEVEANENGAIHF